MGAAPSHGSTMGYVSGPFRTEEQTPDPERVALSAHGETMGSGGFLGVPDTSANKRKYGCATPVGMMERLINDPQ